MRSCCQRFQCRCVWNMRSQLWSVATGLPLTHVRGVFPRNASRRFAASSQQDRI